MPSKVLQVVQAPAAAPTIAGTPEFEKLRASIREDFAEKVPDELRLPVSLIENPPKDVTAIPRECGLLTPEEIEITENYDATALAAAIASRKYTAVAVATAFGKRAIISHQLTCCLMEWFMDEAVETAKALDEHLETTGKTVGPLHGVPTSIKCHVSIKGHTTVVGYLDTREVAKEDSQMVAILRAAGAVFYCKTIQPQSIMHLESHDPVYGRVLNPHNIGLSAGGSTGGEASLVAMRGSIFGMGTDIGGSVRGPSGFCGIFGFKPTSYTLPMQGFLPGGFGAELNVLCSTGPMNGSLRDMDLFMSVMADAKPYLTDPRIIPLPWTGLQTALPAKPLKIGFMAHDGSIVPQPPVIKAIQWARSKIEAAGVFEVKDFAPYKTAEAMRNIRLAYWPDGGKTLKAHLAHTGEPMLPLTEWIIKDAEGTELDSNGVLQQRLIRDEFRGGFAEHWGEQDVDVLICPMFVGPACTHDTALYWNYTAFFNYVDCPGVVFPTPVKALKKGTEDYAPEYQTPLSEECKQVRKFWEEGDFEGAPINLQIVARKYHDNALFGALNSLKEVLEL